MSQTLARNEYAKKDKRIQGTLETWNEVLWKQGYLLNQCGGDPEDYNG